MPKKLLELKVAELKSELEEREEDTSGTKTNLQRRLEEALIREGFDPDTYEFEDELEKKLKENSKQLEEKLEKNSKQLEDNLKENSKQLENKLEQNSKQLENKLEQNSKQLEDKLKENTKQLKEELKENLKENVAALKEELKEELAETKQNFESQIQEIDLRMKEMEQRLLNTTIPGEIKKFPEKRDSLTISEEITKQKPGYAVLPKAHTKPPKLDRKSSWTTLLKKFETAAKSNAWTPENKAFELVCALYGDAEGILDTIPTEKLNDYDHLIQKLEMRYG